MQIRSALTLFSLWMLVLASVSPALADSEIGRIISVAPGCWAERGGARIPLELKMPVLLSDTIATDATGKAQIIFSDDTLVSVAPSSRIKMAEFAFDENGDDAAFEMEVTSGVSRIVTGMIVKKNPDAFKVTTPHATIGIRGTDLSVNVGIKDTSVIANRITGNDIVVTNNATGQRTELSQSGTVTHVAPSGNTAPRPASEEERVAATQSMRQTGTASASSSTQTQTQESSSTATAKGASETPVALPTERAASEPRENLHNEAAWKKRDPNPVVAELKPTDISGSFQGKLPEISSRRTPSLSGDYAFRVALGTGRVSDASMNVHSAGAGKDLVSTSGGTAMITPELGFKATEWGSIRTDEDVLSSMAVNPWLSGAFDKQSGLPGSIEWGLGIAPLKPEQLSGSFTGALASLRLPELNLSANGTYSFNVVLASGAISNAAINIGSGSTAIASASGGSGVIGSDLGFTAKNWKSVTTNETLLSKQAANPSLSGQFDPYTGKPGSMEWGLGIAPLKPEQLSGSFTGALASLRLPELGLSADGTYAFDVALHSGAISNAAINIGSGSTAIASASGGSGIIASDLRFTAAGWKAIATNENLLSKQAVNPSLSGQFDPYTGKPGSMEWGLGIAPLKPEQLSGSFTGALASLRLPELNLSANGTYSFNVVLASGAISNAAINIGSGSTAIASASGGSGVIGSDLGFTAKNWKSVTTNETLLSKQAANPSLSGQFDPYTGKPGSMEWGLGIAPLKPEQLSGSFTGALASLRLPELNLSANGTYSFNVVLASGAISNAAINIGSGSTAIASASGGSGVIGSDLGFTAKDWKSVTTNETLLSQQAVDPSLSGQFDPYTGKPGSMEWGLGIAPLKPEQLSGSFTGSLASLRLPELGLSADGTYAFDVALASGAISNAVMNISSGSTAIASASGGSGVIGSDLGFTAKNWKSVTTNETLLSKQATNPSLSGQFDPYTGKPGSMEWGLGIAPLKPEQLSGSFTGALASLRLPELNLSANGTYSFNVVLASGAISNAAINIGSGSTAIASASGGSGVIGSDLGFTAKNWKSVTTNETLLSKQAANPSLSGQFDPYTGKPGSMEWGLGIAPLKPEQLSGSFTGALASLRLPELGLSADGTYAFDVALHSGAISNAAINIGSGSTAIASASGGSGIIASDLRLTAAGWKTIATNENLLSKQAVNPSLSGQFNPYTGKPGSMEWGLGIAPLKPEQLSGSFTGALASLRLPELGLSADGTYAFDVALHSGAISNAAINIGSGSTAIASASGGSGIIASDLRFTAAGWKAIATNENLLSKQAVNPSLSGQFDPYTGKPGSMEWGLGIAPLTPAQISGTFKDTLSRSGKIDGISEISNFVSYGFTVILGDGKISAATLDFLSDKQSPSLLSFSAGEGNIENNLTFQVKDWRKITVNPNKSDGRYSYGASMTGQFHQYTGVIKAQGLGLDVQATPK